MGKPVKGVFGHFQPPWSQFWTLFFWKSSGSGARKLVNFCCPALYNEVGWQVLNCSTADNECVTSERRTRSPKRLVGQNMNVCHLSALRSKWAWEGQSWRGSLCYGAEMKPRGTHKRQEERGCDCLTFACQRARVFIWFRGTREHGRLQATVSMKGEKGNEK